MSDMHTITESDEGADFGVQIHGNNNQSVTKRYKGNAFLHPSGALFIEPKDGAPVYYGPGQWVKLELKERPDDSGPRMFVL